MASLTEVVEGEGRGLRGWAAEKKNSCFVVGMQKQLVPARQVSTLRMHK